MKTKNNSKDSFKKWLLTGFIPPVAVMLFIVALLEVMIDTGALSPNVLPRPTDLVAATIKYMPLISGEIWATFKNLMLGYFIAVPLAFVLAALLAQSKIAVKMFNPLLLSLACTPLIILVPLLLVWMGFTAKVRVISVVVQALPTILLNTLTGFVGISQEKKELGATYGANRIKMFFKITAPQALPRIFTGLRIGCMVSAIGITSCDLIAGPPGLGYRVTVCVSNLSIPLAYGCILILGLISLVLMSIVTLIEKKVIVWNR